MLARIRKAQEEREGGFTLIELLVVIIIIGILAAIAIPVFLNQRKKAVDASMKSDARTVANEEETYYTDFQSYKAVTSTVGPPPTAVIGADTVTLSPGNTVTVTLNTAGLAYCILATNLKSTTASATAGVVYISSKGGLQPSATTVCPGAGAF
jgi:type IV pilus assembly protein PilA